MLAVKNRFGVALAALITFLVALALITFLVALAVITVAVSTNDGPTKLMTSVTDLEGEWTTKNSEAMTPVKATIADNKIVIMMNADEMNGLYWSGSFIDDDRTNNVVLSIGHVDLMQKSLFGSGATTKEFTYLNDELSFEYTIMGVTQTVTLVRN